MYQEQKHSRSVIVKTSMDSVVEILNLNCKQARGLTELELEETPTTMSIYIDMDSSVDCLVMKKRQPPISYVNYDCIAVICWKYNYVEDMVHQKSPHSSTYSKCCKNVF